MSDPYRTPIDSEIDNRFLKIEADLRHEHQQAVLIRRSSMWLLGAILVGIVWLVIITDDARSTDFRLVALEATCNPEPSNAELEARHRLTMEQDDALCTRVCSVSEVERPVATDCFWMSGGRRQCSCTCAQTRDGDYLFVSHTIPISESR